MKSSSMKPAADLDEKLLIAIVPANSKCFSEQAANGLRFDRRQPDEVSLRIEDVYRGGGDS